MFVVNLGGSYCNMGNHYRVRKQPAIALDWYAKAIAALEPAFQQQPKDRQTRIFLCNAYWGRGETLSSLGRHAEAVDDCNRGLELDEAPMRSQLRSLRARSRARLGEYQLATAEAEEVVAAPNSSGKRLGEAAAVFALASATVRQDSQLPEPNRAGLADQYANRAMEFLRQAVAKGILNLESLKNDTDLEPLRSRPEFCQLVTETEQKTKTKPR